MTIAEKLAKTQKEISISEFFEKNRHLLGYDSKIKAMLTIIKESVDNSLDAMEEMNAESKEKNKIFPEIYIDVKKVEDVYEVLDSNEVIAEVVKRGDDFSVSYQGRRGTFKSRYAGQNFKIGNNTVKLKVENDKLKIYINGKKYESRTCSPKYRVIVRDNGPGIIKEQIPRIFGTLLYGSKFHRQRQSRGQQGIGVTSAILYSQLTTGRPSIVVSKISKNKPAHRMSILIDTTRNRAEILKDEIDKKFPLDHGTQIEMEFEGQYITKGEKSVEEYIKRTAIVNPHATFIFSDIYGKKQVFKRVVNTYPKEPVEIKPHPYGLELGIIMKMLRTSVRKNIKEFLLKDLSRISPNTANIILSKAEIKDKTKPANLTRDEAERLLRALQRTKLLRPQTTVLSPIGEQALEKSLKKGVNPEFVTTITRPPTTYRGMPFQIEVGIAYGGDIKESTIMRFANKIPLLYDQSQGAILRAVQQVGWRRYNVPETSSGLPQIPLILVVHIASVWIPYTSEGKAAIALYPGIIKEIKLSLQDAARELKRYVGARFKEQRRREKVGKFILYAEELSQPLSEITNKKEEKIKKDIKNLITKKIGKGA